MNVDTACLARTYKSLEHPREWNRWFSRGRGRGKKRGVGSALTFLRWHPWNAACGTFERCSLLHSCYIHFAPRIRHFSNRRSRRCFLASRFHSEWIQFSYFVPLCRIRELFSGERERSVNFVRVFATLEIYFRIILLIRKNFPQEKIIPLSKILMVFFLIRSIWKIYQALLSWISGNLFTSEGTY